MEMLRGRGVYKVVTLPGQVLINRDMARVGMCYEACMERIVSPVQREVFLLVDEYWKRYGCSPSLREIAYLRGKSGLGNTKAIVDRLVKLGVLKKLAGKGRSIRPVYIQFRSLE